MNKTFNQTMANIIIIDMSQVYVYILWTVVHKCQRYVWGKDAMIIDFDSKIIGFMNIMHSFIL